LLALHLRLGPFYFSKHDVLHRFVVIPTRHCLNLATAVATVLYDRACKKIQSGEPIPELYEHRGFVDEDNPL